MNESIELEDVIDDPQNALLNALKNNDLEKFKTTYERRIEDGTPIDINHVYADLEGKTLLDIACSGTDKAPYVEYLLKNGADVNRINCSIGAAPIHLAVLHSDLDTVKLLVDHEHIDIHQPNTANETAFQLATQRGRTDLIKLLQTHQVSFIESGQKQIRKSYSTLENNRRNHSVDSSSRPPPQDSSESLVPLLLQENYEAFASKANENNVNYVDRKVGVTYLQQACELGLAKFVELILKLNADPNATGGEGQMTPMTYAAYHGYYDIVQLLLDTGVIKYPRHKGRNIIEILMIRICYSQGRGRAEWKHRKSNKRDLVKCLKLILDKVEAAQLRVDWLDPNNKALQYAIMLDNRDIILLLLEKGAYIGARNGDGKILVELMKPATLKHFLDKAMTITSPHINTGIFFNYDLLTCKQKNLNQKRFNETEPLVAISERYELRPLLGHPFFRVYLDFKWHIIMRWLFRINLVFYTQLVFSLSIYLLIVNYVASPDDQTSLGLALKYFIFANNSIMFLREFAQFIIYSNVNRCQYVTDPTNWVEITLIAVIYTILSGQIESIENRALLAATAIFLSYTTLMLLILSHPRLSVHLEMFRATTINSGKFLMPYLLLILAFALCFHVIYRSTNPTDQSFQNMTQAIFKTLVMSMGEYEVSDILIQDRFISYLIIILFIFLIPIVLFNLLNANAVSDIKAIRKDAELVSIVARAKMITRMEAITDDLFSFLDRFVHHRDASVAINAQINAQIGSQTTPTMREYILEIQNRYSNCFSTSLGFRQIYYKVDSGKSCFVNPDQQVKFVVSPSTQRSIREKLSAEASKGDKVKFHFTSAEATREAATLYEDDTNDGISKNALVKIEDRFKIIEQKLTEIMDVLKSK